MITLLAKLFIKNREDTDSPKVRQAYGILSGAVGIFLNILLFTGKFFVGMLSNSISITADAFNNLSDAGSSVITLIGFKMAGQKPDPGHPFGHGRIEYLSGLAVSAAILIMAFELIKSSVAKIIHPGKVTFSFIILVILIISILVKCYMFLYNRLISKKIHSEAMKATASDSLSDTLATSVVLITTIVTYFTGVNLDGICGIIVGVFILYTGITSAKDTLNPLLGQAPDTEFVQKIKDIVLSYDKVIGIHDLVVHDYGPGREMISLHAEVPANGNILELHDVIDNIERKLQEVLKCDAVIHMDPISTDDEETNELKETVMGYLKEMNTELTLHDFRIVKGPSHTNIIFDIVVPYKVMMKDDEIKSTIENKLHEMNTNFNAVINIDKSFCK